MVISVGIKPSAFWLQALSCTCNRSNLNEDLWSPGADRSKCQDATEQPCQRLQLLLRARQIQTAKPQNCFTGIRKTTHLSKYNQRKHTVQAANVLRSFWYICFFRQFNLNSTGFRLRMIGASIPHTMCPNATKVLESNWLGVFLVEFRTAENSDFSCNCKQRSFTICI